ncbi:MAG TPA: transposase [Castellaniella sp.]|nr:transposase [Castellaniella sp.]
MTGQFTSAGHPPRRNDLTARSSLYFYTFDNDELRAELHQRGAKAVMPPRRNRKVCIDYDREMYKWRRRVENFFARIKEFRRIATRYDKTDTTISAMIFLTSTILALR